MADLPLTKLAETAATVTLGWQPVPGAVGYRFQSAASAPKWSHTWDASRSSVKFGKTDRPYRVQALMAGAEGVWPPPAPPVSPLWDGRASAYTSLPVDPADTINKSEPPGLACIYTGSDIRIVPDIRFGKAFEIELTATSRNPWWQGQTGNSAEIVSDPKRPIQLGQEDWFAQSVFAPSWLDTGSGWTILSQFAYPTLTSPPGSLLVVGSRHWSNSTGTVQVAFERNAGVIPSVGAQSPVRSVKTWRPLPTSRWLDVVVGFRWELDYTGWAVFATRAHGEPGFTVHEHVENIPTAQKLASEPLPLRPVMDKQGGYQSDPSSSWPAGWRQTFRLRGLTRHASRSDAERSLS